MHVTAHEFTGTSCFGVKSTSALPHECRRLVSKGGFRGQLELDEEWWRRSPMTDQERRYVHALPQIAPALEMREQLAAERWINSYNLTPKLRRRG